LRQIIVSQLLTVGLDDFVRIAPGIIRTLSAASEFSAYRAYEQNRQTKQKPTRGAVHHVRIKIHDVEQELLER
jgi:hypothetical protein